MRFELLGDRQQAAQQLGLGALDAHEREAELLRALEHDLAELELLVGRHVAVAAAAHVEVGAERALVEPVLVERGPPARDELVRDDRVGRQHLRGDDLDARADAELGDAVEQAVEVEPAGAELGAGRVEREAELEGVGVGRRRRRRHVRHERRGCGIPIRRRQRRATAARSWARTCPGPPSCPGAICMYGRRSSPKISTWWRLAERDRRLAAHDEQRVLLQVPEHVALLGQLVERVAHALQLEGDVGGRHLDAVDRDLERADRRQPQAAVPGQGQRERETLGVDAQAVFGDESVGHGRVPSLSMPGCRGSERVGDLAHERVLAADLFDRAPRLALALVLAGEVAGVAGVLDGAEHGLPRDLLVLEVLVDVVELRLDEHDVLGDVGEVGRVDARCRP